MKIPTEKLKQVVDNIKKTPHNEMVKRLQDAEKVNKLTSNEEHYE